MSKVTVHCTIVDDFMRRVDFHVFDEEDRLLAPPVKFLVPEEGIRQVPTFSLYREEAQVLMDRLWDLGFRPQRSSGEIKAIKYHLEDMRKLVFQGDER